MVESITVITLLLTALNRVNLQTIFDRDPYESRRRALPGARLVKVLVVYQMIRSEKLRGLIRTLTEHPRLQAALGGTVALNTLSNGIAQRDVGQMVEAWMEGVRTYGPWLERMGRKFARIAGVDASLIKLSLVAYSWAEYRKQSGAAKLHAVLEWARGIPQPLVVTTGKVHDLKGRRPYSGPGTGPISLIALTSALTFWPPCWTPARISWCGLKRESVIASWSAFRCRPHPPRQAFA
jgi:hypothetical protein